MHNPSQRGVRRPPGPAGRWIARHVIRALLGLHWAATRVLRAGRRPRVVDPSHRAHVLLTGTFHSDAWIGAHLAPLAASPYCAGVVMVAAAPVPSIPNVTAVYPPAWLTRVAGSVGARLATFAWTAIRTRPDVVGGFHLLVNGLVAQLAAAAAGSRSLYFCVGGPTEFAGGGYAGENAYFARLGGSDQIVEAQLLRAALHFDDIVTMGTGAASFFKQRRPSVRVHVIGGAIDPSRFHPGQGDPDFDVIFVGRIVPIKRVDRLIGALALAATDLPSIRAVIVGEGPLRADMERLAGRLGIIDRVTFAGRQDDVGAWLRRARVFMLTSASEGVALSLMEATMCGLPAIVPAVGDLGDIVRTGNNGILVPDATEARLARAVVDLLNGQDEYWHFRQAAIAKSVSYRPEQVTALWTPVLRAQSGATIARITPRPASAGR